MTNQYYLFLAKDVVKNSPYGRQDPEQRNLFGIDTIFLNQDERICSYVEAAMLRNWVDEIESWQAHRAESKKYVVSFRFRFVEGHYRAWYWLVDLNTKKVREITRKGEELKKYHIHPDDKTHITLIAEDIRG